MFTCFKKQKMFFIMVIIIILSNVFVGLGAEIKWTGNSVWAPDNYHTLGFVEFANKVRERTNGGLDITVHPGGALGYKGPDLLRAVRDGLLQISEIVCGDLGGEEPLFRVVVLPFLHKDLETMSIFMETAWPYYERAAEKWNQKFLYSSPWPLAALWTKKPVRSIEDMEGLKVRTYDKNGALVVEASGGIPFALPWAEVYTSLATNMIDSCITSAPTAVDGKFWEVLKYVQPFGLTATIDVVSVNLNYFNKLPQDYQDILISVGKEMDKIMWERVSEIDRANLQKCIDNGMELIPVSDEFREQLSLVSEKIIEDFLQNDPQTSIELYNAYNEKKIK